MKRCAYCGREDSTNATHCIECGMEIRDETTSADASLIRPTRDYEFGGLTAEESQQDLVTLLRCRTLVDADLIVSRLASSGIQALIPDEYLMQAICWNLNTYGYVRVQIPPRDYEASVDLLTPPWFEGDPSAQPMAGLETPGGNSGTGDGPRSAS